MAEATIDSLKLEISSSSDGASQGLDALTKSLKKLQRATGKGLGLTAVVNELKSADASIKSSSLDGLTKAVETLSKLGGVKISSSIGNQITAISTALQGANFDGGAEKMKSLVTALEPLGQLGKSNLSSYVNTLKKLPETFAELNKLDMSAVKAKIEELAAALKPLGDEMQKVANGFSAFPAKIQKLIASTNKLTLSNNKASTSYMNLYAKLKMAWATVKTVANKIASWIKLSSDYTETMNLFTVSMGQYAKEAYEYAQIVGDAMGIDPAEWMESQGIFMTLTKGFGVAGDRANTMSQQLTQLGYDLSSFFNISVEDAMTKLQSGISGELEPLRRLGYDLSQAKLEATALSLGIDKAVSSMTQAEKAELRYYAIMTQVTDAHGDMARTLDAPANQMRILNAQITQLGRTLGNFFIPLLNKVLPYIIASVKVLREVLDAFMGILGIELTEVDFGSDSITSATEDITENLEDGQKEAKKLKSYMLGFDELNVINTDDGSDMENLLGTGFSFKLPEYDFLDGATNKRIENIASSIRELVKPLSKLIKKTKEWAKGVNLAPIKAGFEKLGASLERVGEQIFDALGWVYEEVLLPLAEWTLEEAVPTLIESFAVAFEHLGAAFKPVTKGLKELKGDLKPFITWVGEALGVFANYTISKFEKIAGVITEKSTEITSIITGIGDVISTLWGGLEPIANVVLYVVDLLGDLFGDLAAINWAYLIDMTSSFVDIIAGFFNGDWGQMLSGITGIFEAFWTHISSTAQAFWNSMVELFTPVAEWFNAKVIIPVANFFKGLWTSVSGFFVNLWDGIVAVWKNVANWFNTNVITPIVNFFTGMWNGIKAVFAPVVKWFSELFGSVWQAISDMFHNIGVIAEGCWTIIKTAWGVASAWFNDTFVTPVKNVVSGLWNSVKDKASSAWSSIKSTFKGAVNWFNETFVTPIANAFSGAWSKLKEGAKSAWSGIKSVFGSVATFFKDKFQKAWEDVKKVFSVGGKVFDGIKDGIVSAFKTVVNAIIKGINKVVSVPFNAINAALKKMRDVNIFGIEPFKDLKTINVPQIPLLAEGGIVNSGQLFVAREAGAELVGNIGGRTAVMNNDQIVESVSTGVYQAVLAALGGSNEDEGNTNIVINLDGEKIYENQQKIARGRGYNLGMGAFSFG